MAKQLTPSEKSHLVHLLESVGWKEILKPYLQSQRDLYLNSLPAKLLTTSPTDPIQPVSIAAKVDSLNYVINLLESFMRGANSTSVDDEVQYK